MSKVIITLHIDDYEENIARAADYMRDQIINEWGYEEGVDFTLVCE